MDLDTDTGSPKHRMNTVLSFDQLQYTVQSKASPCAKPEDKVIINGVSGIFKPGLNAILGPTGSGKTSLLDILAARKDPKFLDGDILVNGRPRSSNFKCMSGYVPQDDVVMGTLTVRENIYFSAKLRLSNKISDEEKQRMVDDVIEELGLSHVADSKVGDQMIRGVSGGERKRTCIGIELVIAPRVLFLDEPTTGLDSSTAGSVMRLLHRLSRRGRTIIFSIHQPRYSIFKLFDRVMLLAKGKVMYHGAAQEALQYFSSIGHECEIHDNPADFFLDVINGDTGVVNAQDTNGKPNGINNPAFQQEPDGMVTPSGDVTRVNFTNGQNGANGANGHVIEMGLPQNGSSASMQQLDGKFDIVEYVDSHGKKFKESPWQTTLDGEMSPILNEFKSNQELIKERKNIKEQKVTYSASFGTQLYHLSGRTFLNLWRNPLASLMQVVVTIIFGVIVGLIYFDLEDDKESGLQNRVGAFFFLIMNQVFMNLSALELFLSERLMFMHENATGFYRVSVFFFTKIFFDLIPMRILPNIGFCCVVYFMLDLRRSAARFFIFLLDLCLTSTAAAGFCFMFSSLFSIYAVVNLMSALTFVFMMVFGGLIINVNDIGAWISWLRYLSIFRYSLNTLSINELVDIELCDKMTYENGTSYEDCSTDIGNQYLEKQDIAYDTAWDLWSNQLALLLLTIGSLGITYIRLRTINKYK